MGQVKETLKMMIGRAADFAVPSLGREIDAQSNRDRAPRLKRAIIYARLRGAHARGDIVGMEEALASFWKGEAGDQFHGRFGDDRLTVFKAQHAEAIDILAGLVKDGQFTRLVEVGCGDGNVLAESIARLPPIKSAVGIDLNAGVIAQAAAGHAADARLSFIAGEARDWVASHPQAGTVLLSNGGVLEYFSPQNVDALYAAVAATGPAAVVLVEPAAFHHDFDNNPGSFTFGREYSFSHNHRLRLRKAGFEVVFEKETLAFGARLVMTIGIIR